MARCFDVSCDEIGVDFCWPELDGGCDASFERFAVDFDWLVFLGESCDDDPDFWFNMEDEQEEEEM